MKRRNQFEPGKSGNPGTAFKPGNEHRWPSGVSGNPSGKSKGRGRFEETFNEALITEGSPEEAAKLLWEAARAKGALGYPEHLPAVRTAGAESEIDSRGKRRWNRLLQAHRRTN